jgi:hypothetical protein
VKTKLFRTRLPGKAASWRCENEAFVRDVLQILKVQIVKLSLNWQFHCAADPRMIPVQMNVFRSRPLDKLPHLSSGTHFFALQNSISCIHSLSKTHFVRDVPQKLKVEDVSENELSCETSVKK